MKKYAINILVILFLLTPFTLFANGCHANNDTIKVLAIGNSFSQDAVEQYLHELGEAEGITMIIGNMFIGGFYTRICWIHVYRRMITGTARAKHTQQRSGLCLSQSRERRGKNRNPVNDY